MKKAIYFLTVGIIFGSFANFALAKQRIALVIGNANYKVKPLNNPVNDASLVANTLKQLDFEVMYLTNANQQQMENAVMAFGKKLNKNSVGLFYFSGHGIQHNGNNYLIPIDAMDKVISADQLKFKTVNAGYVIETMENSGSGLNLFFLDACRSTPFKGFSRSTERGLARISSAEGILISYATAPGKVAMDGMGKNSPYTVSLVNYMVKPKLPIELMLKKVRAKVKKDTAGKQSPWYEVSIDGDFYFNPNGRLVDIPATVPEMVTTTFSAELQQANFPSKEDDKNRRDIVTESLEEKESSKCNNNFNNASISGSSIGNITINCN